MIGNYYYYFHYIFDNTQRLSFRRIRCYDLSFYMKNNAEIYSVDGLCCDSRTNDWFENCLYSGLKFYVFYYLRFWFDLQMGTFLRTRIVDEFSVYYFHHVVENF